MIEDYATLPQGMAVAGVTDQDSENRRFVTHGSLLNHLSRPLAHVIRWKAFPFPENLCMSG